jgi:hypothetical protein
MPPNRGFEAEDYDTCNISIVSSFLLYIVEFVMLSRSRMILVADPDWAGMCCAVLVSLQCYLRRKMSYSCRDIRKTCVLSQKLSRL